MVRRIMISAIQLTAFPVNIYIFLNAWAHFQRSRTTSINTAAPARCDDEAGGPPLFAPILCTRGCAGRSHSTITPCQTPLLPRVLRLVCNFFSKKEGEKVEVLKSFVRASAVVVVPCKLWLIIAWSNCKCWKLWMEVTLVMGFLNYLTFHAFFSSKLSLILPFSDW